MHPDTVTLYLDGSFLPKMVSEFHMNQAIILPVFFLSPSTPLECKRHTLDVRRTIAFYLHRTNTFRRSTCLFLLPRYQQRYSCFPTDDIQMDSATDTDGISTCRQAGTRSPQGTLYPSCHYIDRSTPRHLNSKYL